MSDIAGARAREALLVNARRRVLGVLRELGFFRRRLANMLIEGIGDRNNQVQTGVEALCFEVEAPGKLKRGKGKLSCSRS
jgi:hypothetical protein